MKRIVDRLFRDLFTSEFSELLDSWALIFAIIPFGALIFCGMYVGQFLLDSTRLGIVLMFVFPLAGFAALYGVRKSLATNRQAQLSIPEEPVPTLAKKTDSPLVVVRSEGSSETGRRTMYSLRRMDALENMYVQKGYAASVTELRTQVGAQFPEVDWNHIVAEPPRSLTAAMQRKEPQDAEAVQTLSR
jgi:hypothetical protein